MFLSGQRVLITYASVKLSCDPVVHQIAAIRICRQPNPIPPGPGLEIY